MKENLFKRVSFLRGLLSLFFLVAIIGNVLGETFNTTYSYGLSGWSLTNYTDQSSYYQVPTGNNVTTSVATITDLFKGKSVTSNVVITINCATYGSGTNPSTNTFSLYKESACTNAIVATQGGTLPTSSTYTNVTYTVSQTNAASLDGDLAIKITKPGKTIRLKSIKVEFTYATSGGSTPVTYTVTVADDIANGTVTADPTSAAAGAEVTLTATPATGYEFGSWNVTNASTSAAITVTNNKFTMPEANVNVSATFNEVQGGGDTPVDNVIFYESFDANTGDGGNDGKWGSINTTSVLLYDNLGWNSTRPYGASACARFGTGSALGSATTPALGYTGDATLIFKAAAWNGSSESTTLKLSIIGDGSIPATVTLKKGEWTTYQVTLTGLTEDSKIKFEGNAESNSRFFLDEVSVIGEPAKELTSLAISGTPTKTTYYDGDTFDTTGLTVTGTFDDNTTGDITSGITWNVTPDPLTAGTTSVRVTATVGSVTSPELTVNDITVNAIEATSIAVKTVPTNTNYIVGETFDPSGLVITKTNNNGSTQEIAYSDANASDFLFEPSLSTPLTKTDTKVTITYEGKSVDQEIIVKAQHRATFSINGNTTFEDVIEGNPIHFPSNPTVDDEEYHFVGWTMSAIEGKTDNAPTYVNASTTMGDADITYYAVFARERQGSSFMLVTKASELAAGDKILIASTTNSKAASSFMQDQHCLNITDVSINNSVIADKGNATVFTLGGSAGAWTLNCIEGSLACYGTSNNNLSMNGECSTWSISIATNSNASITSTQYTSRYIKYNTTSPRFSSYASNTQGTVLPQIYKGSIEYYDYCTTVVSRVLQSIEVKTSPTKIEYKEGEKLDLTGLVLTAKYDNGDEVDIYNGYTSNPANGTVLNTLGENTVTITYREKTCSLTVTVTEIPSHMVTFFVNGTTANDELKEGSNITFPDAPAIDGYEFIGWRREAIDGVSPTDPGNYVKPANEKMGTEDVTYYAVFATMHGSGGNNWNKIMSLDEITEGTYVITSGGYAIDNGSTTNSPKSIVAPSVSDNIMDGTAVTNKMKWSFVATGNVNEFQIKSVTATNCYLYTTQNNDGVNVSTSQSYPWTFQNHSSGVTGCFSMLEKQFNRYLGLQTTNSDPRWISSTNATSGNFRNRGKIEIYKLSETTYSDFWTSLKKIYIAGDFKANDSENWLSNPMHLEQDASNPNIYIGTISSESWDSNRQQYKFKLIEQDGQNTEWWTNPNYEYDFSTRVEDSTDANTPGGVDNEMVWVHNNAFDSYYVTAEYSDASWHLSIYGIKDSWDNIAIIGNFPNNNWDKNNPMVLPKIAENKFQGTINASLWTLENNPYKFKLYNNDYGIEWGSEGNMITFAETDEQIFAEGYSWAPMSWTHNTDYKSYFVKAEYKQSEDEIHYEWDVTITGIRDGAYLPGSWNEWITSDMGVRFEDDILVLSLEAEHLYEFKIFTPENCAWYGNSGTMTSENCTGWSFNQDANCSLQTTVAGDYIFYLKWNNGVPSITVEYPEDIKVDITSAKYATYYHSKRSYKVHKDLEGYIAYYDNGWKFENVYHPGDVVPAGVGIILKGNANTYKMALADKNENGAVYEKNRLEGTDVQTNLMDASDYDANSYYYALQKGKVGTANEGKVGMFWMNSAGDAFNNKAHKAYMRVPKSVFNGNEARLSGFAFEDEEATGVSEINVNIDGGDIYNLNGQRINTPVSGHIYIMNGHKFIAK